MELVKWCELCNSRPSNGILTILDPVTNKPEDVQACEPCVVNIPQDDWIKMTEKENAMMNRII